VSVHGLLLAAGAGRRMGGPKALVRGADGEPWVVRGVRVLRDGGCDQVDVVLGASADEALPLLDGTGAAAVVAADWHEGMAASLRAGLASVEATDADAVVVSLVDLPDVGADVVRRLLAEPTDAATLRRAAYDGKPGHPVVLGRDHWAPVAAGATGDRGARDYLASRAVELVECGDLAGGEDVDTHTT
jgi:CTP:molybdopterin cytidylyltransferase MocA